MLKAALGCCLLERSNIWVLLLMHADVYESNRRQRELEIKEVLHKLSEGEAKAWKLCLFPLLPRLQLESLKWQQTSLAALMNIEPVI